MLNIEPEETNISRSMASAAFLAPKLTYHLRVPCAILTNRRLRYRLPALQNAATSVFANPANLGLIAITGPDFSGRLEIDLGAANFVLKGGRGSQKNVCCSVLAEWIGGVGRQVNGCLVLGQRPPTRALLVSSVSSTRSSLKDSAELSKIQ